MVRIFGLHQNNGYFAQSLSRTIGTIRHVVSFSVRSEINGKRTHKKPSRLPSNYTSYRKHEQRSRVRFKNQKDVTITARTHNWKWYFAVNRISGLNSPQWLHQKTVETHASGNREAFTFDDRWKANWWTTSWCEKSRWK